MDPDSRYREQTGSPKRILPSSSAVAANENSNVNISNSTTSSSLPQVPSPLRQRQEDFNNTTPAAIAAPASSREKLVSAAPRYVIIVFKSFVLDLLKYEKKDYNLNTTRLLSTNRLSEMSIDGYTSALSAALVDPSKDKDATHGLHSKINEARKQIEDILASTKGVDMHMTQLKSRLASGSGSSTINLHPSMQSVDTTSHNYTSVTGGKDSTILDEAEFTRRQQALMKTYTRRPDEISLPSTNTSPKVQYPTSWPTA